MGHLWDICGFFFSHFTDKNGGTLLWCVENTATAWLHRLLSEPHHQRHPGIGRHCPVPSTEIHVRYRRFVLVWLRMQIMCIIPFISKHFFSSIFFNEISIKYFQFCCLYKAFGFCIHCMCILEYGQCYWDFFFLNRMREVDNHIEDFLNKFKEILDSTTKDEFDTLVNRLGSYICVNVYMCMCTVM